MPLHIAFLAGLSSRAETLSLHEQVIGLTPEGQISKCREMETEARLLASGESSENREGHLCLANRWADLALEIERDYYLLQSR
jgi:hypothetical protein